METALKEAFRVLKKGGSLFVASPRLQPDYFLKRQPEIPSTMGPFRLRGVAGPLNPPPANFYGYYYSAREISRLLKKAGFTRLKKWRVDLLGGLAYSPLLSRRLREPIEEKIRRFLETPAGDHLPFGRRLFQELFLTESGPLAFAALPLLSPLRRCWSYWNVVTAVK